jgi:Transcription factor Tfb4
MNSVVEPAVFSKLMNCVFVLESREIIFDVLDLMIDRKPIEITGKPPQSSGAGLGVNSTGKQDYLQQATQKTRGVYLPVENPTKAMIQLVLQTLVMSKSQRDTFKMPYLTATRFSGSCSCHDETVELAYVCSACLAIYCQRGRKENSGTCDFCKEKYDIINFNQVIRPLNSLIG